MNPNGSGTMRLYHGNPERDFTPTFGLGRDQHDYGRGFYLTEFPDLAREWAVAGLRPLGGGMGKHIENILSYLEDNGNSSSELCKILAAKKGLNLTKKELEELIEKMDKVNGLGESTWTKFLYFFEIKVEIPEHGFQRCQIYDAKIKDSLNASQFNELEEFNKKNGISMWKQDDKGKKGKPNYFMFMKLLSALSDEIGFDKDDEHKLDKLENFLFHYNLDFKF